MQVFQSRPEKPSAKSLISDSTETGDLGIELSEVLSPASTEEEPVVQNRMGPDFEQLYRELDHQIEWLFHKWGEFRELFMKGPERIDVLNIAASNFFYFLHKLMFEDMMLHLSRLTDPPETLSQTNLSVRSVVKFIDGNDTQFKANLECAIDKLRQACEFARTWRNKSLAHTDLSVLRNQLSSLPSVHAQDLEGAMKAIGEFMYCVEHHYGLPHSVLAHDVWGAKSLARLLEVAVEARDEKMRQWRELAKGQHHATKTTTT
jgi:hypothetical protein